MCRCHAISTVVFYSLGCAYFCTVLLYNKLFWLLELNRLMHNFLGLAVIHFPKLTGKLWDFYPNCHCHHFFVQLWSTFCSVVVNAWFPCVLRDCSRHLFCQPVSSFSFFLPALSDIITSVFPGFIQHFFQILKICFISLEFFSQVLNLLYLVT